MSSLNESLSAIRDVARRSDRLGEAEERFFSLIASTPAVSLLAGQMQIRKAIDEIFLPKRRAKIVAKLDLALIGTGSLPSSTSHSPADPVTRADALALFKNEIQVRTIDIADRHLFQWPYYETFAAELYEVQVPRALASSVTLNELTAAIRERLAIHSTEIFQRGYSFTTTSQRLSHQAALEKGSSGLVRMLGIATSEYRKQLTRLRNVPNAHVLRDVCSAMVAGSLMGFCRTAFGGEQGALQLLVSWKLWVNQVPFLTGRDLEHLAGSLPNRVETDRLVRMARPVAAALDEQIARATPDRVCVLRECNYSGAFDRLEVSLVEPLHASSQGVTFHCYLGEKEVATSEIESAVERGMELIMLPLTEQLSRWAWRHEPTLGHLLIDTAHKDSSDRLRHLLSLALASIGSAIHEDVPLRYNFARRFPLDKPDIGTEFRVPRVSVRRLLDLHHSDSGVRVWCSVRRSGKTTACQDLQSHQGAEVVITETCESTGIATLKDTFFQATMRALEDGSQLPSSFVSDTIRKAADYDLGKSKIIFVLDEYESLFRRLEIAGLGDEKVRYAVVQPLLNQMVAFAQSNLLILLGLRPDAHFILMDQNQLSPYVRADQFPLFEFERNRPDCEFRDLVGRVLTERIQCDDAFIGHLFAETGGHPVLTVNVLTAFCDWLIATERSLSRLRINATDFETFASLHLSSSEIGLADVYDVHRKFARQGLSAESRVRTPWLYAVLHVLRHLASVPGGTMSCGIGEVAAVLQRLGLDQSPGIDAEDLVRSGAMANFFKVTGRSVKPRIKLYARLTASVVPSARV